MKTQDSENTVNSTLIILDNIKQWLPYYETDSVITAIDYLRNDGFSHHSHLVINLCSDFSYHSEGYYCSLLAQARKHKVIPSIDTLNKLGNKTSFRADNSLMQLCRCNAQLSVNQQTQLLDLDLYFGKSEDPQFERLARYIFDQYPTPLLRASFSNKEPYQIINIRPLALQELDDHQQDLFAHNLDRFNRKVWRQPRSKKSARYDLAIFHDPGEAFPPSNKTALNLFVNEAKKMNINAELITEADSARLMEFDALFIRQTTAVNHITYRLAQAAQQADMIVIDDPPSIIRCTNKVYLKELLDNTHTSAPNSKLLFRNIPVSFEELSAELGGVMVIKIPDGSFSIGVSKVSTKDEYDTLLSSLFQHSSILLAQEFLPTEFDWRIGVLNGDCIFACKYYMARSHWQIYHHKAGSSTKSGKVETIPVHNVPRKVTRIATKISTAIGKGFYGVDIKEVGNDVMVIEVNDNPSIDHGIEDKILGGELYRIILREFTRRLSQKRRV